MRSNRLAFLRLATFALMAAVLPGCEVSDDPGSRGYNLAGPVNSTFVVSLTSNRSSLTAGDDHFATLTVTAVVASSGAPVPNLTVATLTTNIGQFGSLGGTNTAAIELVNGVGTVVMFPGDTIGTASVRAQVGSGVAFTDIRIR